METLSKKALYMATHPHRNMKILTTKEFSYLPFQNRSKTDGCRCGDEYIAIKILNIFLIEIKNGFLLSFPKTACFDSIVTSEYEMEMYSC